MSLDKLHSKLDFQSGQNQKKSSQFSREMDLYEVVSRCIPHDCVFTEIHRIFDFPLGSNKRRGRK